MSEHVDFCIHGAGLAGISLALELQKTNASICVVDPNGIAGGASGTPIGLANPATGRFATKSWNAEACLQALLNNLEFVQDKTPVQFYKPSGILRPALDSKIASKMKENYEITDWPDDWVYWLDERELKEFHPGIHCIDGGVWVKSGLTVDFPTYLNSAADWLKQNGVGFSFEKNPNVSANIYITTSGVWSKENPTWSSLPLIPVKGQTLLMESDEPLSFNHAISALGYIGSLSKKTFIVGSTYEHHFKHEDIDKQGKNYMIERASRVLPGLIQNSKVINQWASIRSSTPDRLPILGNHNMDDSQFIFTGLGSKGLVYSAYCAKLLANHILDKSKFPEEISLTRFNK